MSTQNELKNNEASQVLDRLAMVLKVNTVTGLADALGVAQTTVSNWRVRNSIPFQHCLDISKRVDISLDWLLTGQGDMYKSSLSSDSVEHLINQVLIELDEPLKREVFLFIQQKKEMQDLKRQINKLVQERRTA